MMISSLGSNSSFNLYSVGNVSSYVKNLMNVNKITGSSTNSIFTSATDTVANTSSTNATFTKQNASNLSHLKSAASALSNAARSLGNGSSSLVSSDANVVSTDATYYSRSNLSFDVSVQNLASQQVSKSEAVKSTDSSAFDVGKNSFRIQTESGSFDIEFSVNSTDTNQDSLNAIAQSINNSKAGVSAKVVTENGNSYLEMTSDGTGAASAFSIENANGGNAASRLDVQTSQQAVDANYTVNGKSYSSSENTVSIPDGRGATMTLNGTGSASLTRGTDASKLVTAAQNFATAYNSAMSHLMSGSADGAGVSRALNLIADNKLTAMSAANYGGYASSRLGSMGITIDEDGKMQVDAEKLTTAVQENPSLVQNALSGYGSLADKTIQNVDAAQRIPAATYTNFSNMQVENSLISALLPSTGSLFDFSL